ncbi:(p)ppGpp synthetase [Treponema putidum]|uniref:(P)ppGpp synthetase n=1 Tax=Treponema putidum TaxID=221027 RepID=A0AAE9MTS4_9SPIR|nr:(p)ppGpp synthetase [Treponema putidum]UTY32485.1 (p)ppGpp synthetase [Treponema putidum]UTY34885.1 (p)ppGpp synthetase [Treponema putidum]
MIVRIEEFLRSIIKITSTPTYKTRVKSFNSYYLKLLKFPPKKETSDLPVLTDIMGVRIICPFLQDINEVETVLLKNFTVIEVERKGSERTFREFGYESVHFLLEIPEEFKVGLVLPKDLIFEIQLRTILQDAWAEVEHELIYKSEFSPFDQPLKRKLASINASLSLADIIFQEIRDYQNKLNAELEKRRLEFYSMADEHTAMVLPETNTVHHDNPDHSEDLKVAETIDDLILSAIEAHNQNLFGKAEKIYTKIIEQNPNDIVLSVVFKHRGMAYFAQANYEEAYSDFLQSCKYNPANFRSHYYVGIALTLLNRDDEAIEYFSKSLEINKFQAHVYFRRALSYFKLALYPEAAKDLDSASDLGLPEEDVKKLRIAIAKKIDMV